MDKTLFAGTLRHRIAIQEPTETQDPNTGEITIVWNTVSGMSAVPAEIAPLSAKEFIAGQAIQSEIVARITIRYRAGITAKMRAVHGSKIYNIRGVLQDPKTGIDWLTLPVSEGTNAG